MKTILNLTILTSVFFFFTTGCNTNDTFTETQLDVVIEFKTECGWCAGVESISVTPDKIQYFKQIPCGEKEGIKQKERLISSEEWNKVTESFDFAVFETLDFSECNICVDGCDEIIQITQQHKTHKISYTPNTKMNEIEELQKILYELTTEMRKMN